MVLELKMHVVNVIYACQYDTGYYWKVTCNKCAHALWCEVNAHWISSFMCLYFLNCVYDIW